MIDLDYFNSYLKKLYKEDKIIIIKKDLYYRSIILFIKRVKNLTTIKSNTLIKTNLNISLRDIILR